jgi:S-adenosylmethionine hydrolase
MIPPVIALLTDFGLQDSYVGVMKGVIIRSVPDAKVIDITHAIRPQDILHGAYTLSISVPYFPRRTIFCCVVDPGVGSDRYPIAVKAGQWVFVAPDNGLLSLVFQQYRPAEVVILNNPVFHLNAVSSTFHGRDIFARVAGHLAKGKPMSDMGDALDPSALRWLEVPVPHRIDNKVEGNVLHIDHFGNIITSLRRDHLGSGDEWLFAIDNTPISQWIYTTYTNVAIGDTVAYIGSDGYLEIAIRNGNAAAKYGIKVGMNVRATQTVEQAVDRSIEHPVE